MTEDQERYQSYINYGGWSTVSKWMELALVENVKSYAEVLKNILY